MNKLNRLFGLNLIIFIFGEMSEPLNTGVPENMRVDSDNLVGLNNDQGIDLVDNIQSVNNEAQDRDEDFDYVEENQKDDDGFDIEEDGNDYNEDDNNGDPFGDAMEGNGKTDLEMEMDGEDQEDMNQEKPFKVKVFICIDEEDKNTLNINFNDMFENHADDKPFSVDVSIDLFNIIELN